MASLRFRRSTTFPHLTSSSSAPSLHLLSTPLFSLISFLVLLPFFHLPFLLLVLLILVFTLAWGGIGRIYEWDDEDGEVGPKFPKLEMELFAFLLVNLPQIFNEARKFCYRSML